MRDLNEHSITDAVLACVRQAGDPRIRQISEALVRHLHAFIREVEPTEAEWAAGIEFLTKTGHLCDAKRQEFILLSDALGVSMLVDAINHRAPAGATETTVFGPFYVEGPPEYEMGADISQGMVGEPLYVEGRVSALNGTVLSGAIVDVWHADAAGFYDVQQQDALAGRARFHTDENGRYSFWTVRPSAYPIPDDGTVGAMLKAQGRHPYRPAHVHFMIRAPGYVKLVTHVFASGDEYLDSDVVFGVKESIIEDYIARPPGLAPDGKAMDRPYQTLRYDFVLKPE